MKTKNLLFSGAIALSTILSPTAALLNSAPVFAAKVTVSLPEGDVAANHSYVAYKIFDGTIAGDGNLTNIKWATGVDSAVVLEAARTAGITNAAANTSAAAFAEMLTEGNSLAFAKELNKVRTTAFSTEPTPIVSGDTDLDAGYWLLVDTKNNNQADAFNGLSVLKVSTNSGIVITPKNSKPTVDKQVQDNDNKDVDHTGDGWGETADIELNKTFNFRITAENLTWNTIKNYDSYKLVLHDEWSDGITYLGDENVTVTLYVGETSRDITEKVSIDSKTANKLTVSIANLKTVLNEAEKVDGNSYKIVVEYQAKLNDSAVISNSELNNKNSVYLEYSNNPGTDGTGKTDEDKVYVGSFELDVTKEDTDHNKLPGAKFVLKNNGQVAVFKQVNGVYKFQAWIAVGDTDPEGTSRELVSDNNGKVVVDGLDEGTYSLEETAAPEGYTKKTEPTTVTITATEHHEDSTAEKGIVDLGESKLAPTVVNSKISDLPETGGMGTTMLYSVGTVLVGGAAIAYVTNKRMRRED